MQTRGPWIMLPENAAARQAVERVRTCLISQSRRQHNPLLLHGPPGTGKSRLLDDLASTVGRDAPDLIIRVLPASDLATLDDEGISALRQADVIGLDDVHHLPARRVEMLVGLIDYLLPRQRQLIFTASAGPAQLDQLPARLTSRLSAGLVVTLLPLSPESRLQYLRHRVNALQMRLGDDVIRWLAGHTPGSARQLDGALTRLLNFGRPIALDNLPDFFSTEAETSRPTMERITQQVSRYFRVAPRQLCSARRSRAVLLPRQISMYLARQLTDLSLEQIGAHFGGRDHSTVLHACRKVEEALSQDAELGGAVRRLHADLA